MIDLRARPFRMLLFLGWVGCDADSGAGRLDAGADAAPGADAADAEALALTGADPAIIDPRGGSQVVLTGTGLAAVEAVRVGGVETSFVAAEDGLIVHTPGLPVGPTEVVVVRGGATASAPLEVWSPAELPGARLFDAAAGITTEEAGSAYEWQRLAEDVHPDWRIRDGNTTTWFPPTGTFIMVGGWNGEAVPVGFSPPEAVGTYPPLNTTNEVWSSPDAVHWTLELPHDHGQFQRRHVHNTVVWNDRLWIIGGDAHQGFYNHDVLSSADGRTWDQVLPPGSPPWPPRSLQFSGVFQGRLWTGGGQTILGPEDEYAYFNDLWVTDDGASWTQVAADGPGSATRWAGCAAVDGLVEFQDRLWLVGCARYQEVGGHVLIPEVWSTADGVTWQRHPDPPWAGRIWHNVVVWDGKLWILFGYSAANLPLGWSQDNSKEAWYTTDGATWQAATWPDSPVPGSHAQGVAVTDEALVYVGGNHTFGLGAGPDRSIWRFVPFRGAWVSAWQDRAGGLSATAAGEARPLRVPDAFGPDRPGLHFNGSRSVLALAAPDEQPDGRTVLWVARQPYLAGPYGWEEAYAPLASVVGGVDQAYPNSSIGLSGGRLVMVNREAGMGPAGEPLWTRVEAGDGLQEGPGEVRLVGLSHATDGTVTAWIDGLATPAGIADYSTPRSYSRLGGSQDDDYYGPNTRFAGTLGAVLVLPAVVDAATMARIHAWARGRFGVP